MTVIFGEDGKEILTPVNPKQEKSVYDMEDEDFSATKATPFPGIYSNYKQMAKNICGSLIAKIGIFMALPWPKILLAPITLNTYALFKTIRGK